MIHNFIVMLFIKEKIFTEKRFVYQQVPEPHAESQPKEPEEPVKPGTAVNDADLNAAGNEAIKAGEKKAVSAEVQLSQMVALPGQSSHAMELSTGVDDSKKGRREIMEKVNNEILKRIEDYIEAKCKGGSEELKNPRLFAENLMTDLDKVDRSGLGEAVIKSSFSYSIGKEKYTFNYIVSRETLKIIPPIS
jgi:hypothetical protein